MITLLAETENYMVKVEDVVDEPTGEEVCFVHIDTYKMGKGVLKELKQMLAFLMEERKNDVCFYSELPESLKLANALKPLDAVYDIECAGRKVKVGIWEYN